MTTRLLPPTPQPLRPTAQPLRPTAQPLRPTAQPLRPTAQPLRPTAQPLDPGRLGTILSVWAHPDDETYLAGGTMAAAAAGGERVVCAWATAGERGTPDAATWPPDRLGRMRRWEAAAAMAVLGIQEHRFGGLPDGDLADHGAAGRAWVAGLLDEVRPDTILTFGPDGMTYHPDHVAVHHWVTDAWVRRGRRARLLQATTTVERVARFRDQYEAWGMYMTDERPTGATADQLALHVRLEGSALDRKLTALHALASQTRALTASTDPSLYALLVAEEAFVDACSSESRDSRPDPVPA